MRETSCCFTGHREITDDRTALKEKLTKTVKELIGKGIKTFYAGGARGFDTLAAQVVLECKRQGDDVRLVLILPCPSGTWNSDPAHKEAMQEVLSGADETVLLSKVYYRGCMHVRNQHLVNNSSVCVCYKRKDKGGTVYTIEYAQDHGLTVIKV